MSTQPEQGATVLRLPFWRQMRWNLVVYFVALAVLPVLIAVSLTLHQTTQQARAQVYAQLESVATLKSDQISAWLEEGRSALSLLLADPDGYALMVQMLSEEPPTAAEMAVLNEFLAASVETHPRIKDVFLYNRHGQIVAAADPTDIGKLVTRQPYFIPSFSGTRRYTQLPYYDVVTNRLSVVHTLAVTDATGNVIGVLAGVLDVESLGEIMTERAGLGASGETYLVSTQNNYLLTPSRAPGYPLARAYHSQGIDAVLNFKNGSGTYDNYQDPPVRVMGVYRWIPELKVGLLAEMAESEALASVALARTTSTILAIIAALVAVGIGYVVITGLSNPITDLTATALRLAGGELSVRSDVRTWNEIGVLADSFNSMADQLEGMIVGLEERVRERTRDLEVAAEVARDISAALDLDALLSRVVELTKASFNLYHAHVYLLDEPSGFLIMEAGAGEPGRAMKAAGHRIPLHAEVSLVARAARTGQAVIVNDVQAQPDYLPNPLLPATRSEMAVPLMLGEQAIGVLDVQSEQPDRFSDADARVLTTLAGQVAVAVQNARLFEQTGRSERLLRSVIDASSDWIWAKDADFRWILMNRAFAEQALGISPQEGIGKTDYDFLPAEVVDGDPTQPGQGQRARDRAVLTGDTVDDSAVPVRRHDGSERLLDTRQEPLTDAEGKIIGILSVARDVTEREQIRRRQQTAYELGERLNAVLDMDELLRETVTRLSESFQYYHAHVYLYDDTSGELVVREGLGAAGAMLKEMKHSIPLQAQRSLVARAARTLEPVVVNNVLIDPDHLPNPLLPETASEVALPLFTGDQLLGVLDVQHNVMDHFTDDEVRTLRIIAGQLAVALTNARLFAEAQSALAETAALQARLEAIISAANSAILSIDQRRGLILINRAAQELFGYSAEEAGGLPLSAFIVDPDELLKARDTRGERTTIEFTARRKDQSEFPAEGSAAWITLEGNPVITVVLNDITERRRIERRERLAYDLGQVLTALFNPDVLLRETVEHLGAALGYYHAHIYLLDEEHKLLHVAEGLGEAGAILKEMKHSIPMQAERSLVARAARTLEPVVVNDVTASPDHLPNPLLPETLSEVALPLHSGQRLLGVLDVQHNIAGYFTEPEVRTLQIIANQLTIALSNAQLYQEQIEARARAERINRELALLNRVIEAAASTLNKVDMLKAVCYEMAMAFDVPQAAAALLAEDRATSTVVAEYLAADRPSALGDVIPVTGNPLADLILRDKRPIAIEDVRADPRSAPVSHLLERRGTLALLIVPLIVEGEVVGTIGLDALEPRLFTEDEISLAYNVAVAASQALLNAQLYEQQLAQAERLRELDRLKGEFLANVSHELRTPLNSIIGYSELLIDELGPTMDEMSLEDLKAIHSSGHHLLAIINDILDLAKIEAGRLELNRAPLDFAALAGQVMEAARVLIKDKPEVALELDLPADLPPIEADAVRLRQVLWNLLSNAIKFTEQGSVRLAASADNGALVVAVQDTGIGIPPQYHQAIFDQFRQADGSTTRRSGGTGLGLAITRQLVWLHGGDIRVDSTLGKGSTFTVTLPITPSAPRRDGAGGTGELAPPAKAHKGRKAQPAEAPGD